MGFLQGKEKTVLHRPHLRDPVEIEGFADLYVTLHWRLRQQLCSPGTLDLVDYVSKCKWGPFDLTVWNFRIMTWQSPGSG